MNNTHGIITALNKGKNYLFSSSSLFVFFASWAIWWSFYAIWLEKAINLNGEQTGDIYAINSTASLIFMLLYGVIQDKLRIKKTLLIIQSIILLSIAPFVIYFYEPMLKNPDTFYFGAVVGGIVLSAGFISGCPLLESFNERVSRIFNFQYGTARAWGSFGYAVSALVAGICFAINPHINFWIASAIGLIYFIIIMIYSPNANKESEARLNEQEFSIPDLKDIVSVLKLSRFWAFAFFIVGTMSFYTIYDQQMFPKFYKTFFVSEQLGEEVWGYLNSFQVFLEAACFLVVPFIINKMSAKKALLLGAIVMFIRIVLSASFDDVYMISIIKLLHAIETPLFILSMFKYINHNFDSRLSATLYLVGFQIASQVGVILLSKVSGIMLDELQYHYTFYVMAGIVLVVTLISAFTLSNNAVKE